MLAPWKKIYDQSRQHIKKQRHHFANKCPYSQSYVFSGSHVWMWELHHKESCVPKNWCFLTVALENTLESPSDSKEIKLVNPKGNQPWLFIGRTDAEAEAPIPWPPDAKRWLTGKNPDAEKIEGRRRRGDREWDSWMASRTQQTSVWANSRSWWWTGKPAVLQTVGSQSRTRLSNWTTTAKQWLEQSEHWVHESCHNR